MATPTLFDETLLGLLDLLAIESVGYDKPPPGLPRLATLIERWTSQTDALVSQKDDPCGHPTRGAKVLAKELSDSAGGAAKSGTAERLEVWLRHSPPAGHVAVRLTAAAYGVFRPGQDLPLSSRLSLWIQRYQESVDDTENGRKLLGRALRPDPAAVPLRIMLRACFDVAMGGILASPELHGSFRDPGTSWDHRKAHAHAVSNLTWDGLMVALMAGQVLPSNQWANRHFGKLAADVLRSDTLKEGPTLGDDLKKAARAGLWMLRPPFSPVRGSGLAKSTIDVLGNEIETGDDERIWGHLIGERAAPEPDGERSARA